MHILPLGRRHRAQNLANDIPYRVAQRVRTRTPCRFHCCCRVCSLSAPCVWRLATRQSPRSPPLLAARIPESRPSAVDDRRRRRPRPRSPAAHASPQPLHAQPQPCVRQHPRAHAQERLRHVPHSMHTRYRACREILAEDNEIMIEPQCRIHGDIKLSPFITHKHMNMTINIRMWLQG